MAVSYELVQAFADEMEANGDRTKAVPKAKAIRSFMNLVPMGAVRLIETAVHAPDTALAYSPMKLGLIQAVSASIVATDS